MLILIKMIDMSFLKIIEYWQEGSRKDFEVARGLYSLKHYSHCLFFCHLSIEKMMKAIFVARKNEHAPFIHDVVILAGKAGIPLNKSQKDQLETITSFNIQGRYADYKSEFYKKYNNQKTAKRYVGVTKNFLLWLEKKFLG
ncbi:HEPN domain-containing protein [Candidatus Uhrbacteria bacterium]|nr:HEPN domain-containing protein [Candidatus Uhrbacteria bacterium]